jgi:hypothetical protein
MESSIFQIKISIEILANRVEQVENRVSRSGILLSHEECNFVIRK